MDGVISEFASNRDCRLRLESVLDADGSDDVTGALLGGFADLCEVPGDPSASAGLFEARVGRWVIRDEDLKLFAAVRDATVAFAGAQLSLHNLTVSAVASGVLAALQLAHNARQAGGWLTPRQLQIILVLETTYPEPLSRTNLKLRLPPGWTAGEIDAEVQMMKTVPTRRGVIKVVDELADGKVCLCVGTGHPL